MAKKSISDNNLQDSIQDSEGNVDQIRQILFGGQMRDYEQRFDAIEKRLSQSIERASASIDTKLEKLSENMQSEVEKINEQMKKEREERASDGKESRTEAQGLRDHMESGFVELEMQLANEIKELRNTLLDQNEELATQIKASREAVTKELQRETGELTDTKLARKDMAALLSDIASRLNNDSDSVSAS